MNITPRDVNYFLAVAHHGRLAPAAEACHVTQPALTKAIQRLEAGCGLILFERDARGTRLTAEGARFREVAESLSRSYENALRVAANVRAQQAGLLRVGCTDVTRASLVPATLAALLQRRPGLRATFEIGRSDQLAAAVRDGRLDVAVVPTYGEAPMGCDCLRVGDDPHLPVMSAKHPLAHRERLTPRDLTPFGWIHAAQDSAGVRSLNSLFARFQLPPPTITVEFEYMTEAALALLRESNLLAMIPCSFHRVTDQHGLRLLDIPDFKVNRPVYCLTRSGTEPSPLTQAFCDLVAIQTQIWRVRDEKAA